MNEFVSSLEMLQTAVTSMGFAVVMSFMLLGAMVILFVGLIKLIGRIIDFRKQLINDMTSTAQLVYMQKNTLEQILWEVRGTRSDIRETIQRFLDFCMNKAFAKEALEELSEKLRVLQPSELKEPSRHGD